MGLRVISIKMEEDLIELLDSYARKLRTTRSELIRNAVEELLNKNLKENNEEEDKNMEFKILKIIT
jgi:metal-responsive CopG/Arc/MetJ family transcriptional regulator